MCPAKTQIRLGICPVWSVFAVCIKKAWVLSYPLSEQQRLIRLGGCPGWSESSLGAHVILSDLSCYGSYISSMSRNWKLRDCRRNVWVWRSRSQSYRKMSWKPSESWSRKNYVTCRSKRRLERRLVSCKRKVIFFFGYKQSLKRFPDCGNWVDFFDHLFRRVPGTVAQSEACPLGMQVDWFLDHLFQREPSLSAKYFCEKEANFFNF